MALANQEAQRLNHDYIGTEHLLLGLLRERDGIAAQVLTNLGLLPENVRQEVLNLLGHGSGGFAVVGPTGLPSFTENARKVMARANQEALHYNHDCIASHHILLALAKEEAGEASRVLRNHKIDPEVIEREVMRSLKPGKEPVRERDLPLTPIARRVVAYAAKEAGDRLEVGTEHLLMALMWDPETVIARVLTDLGLRHDEIRREVRRLHRGSYRDLAAWRKADELAYHVHTTTQAFPKKEARGIVAQLRRIALSIPVSLMKEHYHRDERRFRESLCARLRSLNRLRYLLDLSRKLKHLKSPEHKALCERVDDVSGELRTLRGTMDPQGWIGNDRCQAQAACGRIDMSEHSSNDARRENPPVASYKDLPVWQKADLLACQVYTVTKDFPQEEMDGIIAPLRETVLQIPLSIAEAYGPRVGPGRITAEPWRDIALRSLTHVQYLLDFAARLGYLDASQDQTLRELAGKIEAALETNPTPCQPCQNESQKNLSELGKMLIEYVSAHQDCYPDSLEQYEKECGQATRRLDFEWVHQHAGYLGKGKSCKSMPPDMPIAYDKTVLAEKQETYVLFNAAYVRYASRDRCIELGLIDS
ncbi:MAG TPA: four helix bundle protein [Sedimentisphaerales bacterium]|nr:four helix bundle protein [Sedimentisphaerales bacterium]